MTKTALTQTFLDYIRDNGGIRHGYGWYAGVTSDPERRLFQEHWVKKRDGAWIYGAADSDSDARDVERHLFEIGCSGDSGGGDSNSVYVYAYRINLYTRER